MAGGNLLGMLKPCLGGGSSGKVSVKGSSGNRRSCYTWEKPLGRHMYGQYSMAVTQANWTNEDRCHLESGPLTYEPNGLRGVFVGVYDGHGGHECSEFVLRNLYTNLRIAVTNHQQVSPEVLTEAYQRTEHSFLGHVRANWEKKPHLASVGTCCLTGVVHNNTLYVANAGDSRAIVGKWAAEDEPSEAHQLSAEHNAKVPEVRDQLQAENPEDQEVVKKVNDCWRVRGIIQVTRAIGDFYLKYNEFNCQRLIGRFRQDNPIVRPLLKAEPEVVTYQLTPEDRFAIFASDGLWDALTNADAVRIVRNSARSSAAKELLIEGLERLAGNKDLTYKDVRHKDLGERRYFHDDISIVVLFFDNLVPVADNV